jgi:hypothetical protein
MYLPFRIKYVTIKSHCPYFFLEKGNLLKFLTDFNSNKCLQWKDTSTHKVLLRKIKKAKKEYIFNGCLLVWIKLKLEVYTVLQLGINCKAGLTCKFWEFKFGCQGHSCFHIYLRYIYTYIWSCKNGINVI